MKRFLFLIMILLVMSPISAQNRVWPDEVWLTSAPEAQDINSTMLADTIANIRSRNMELHSLLMIRNGYLVLDLEAYPFENSQPHVQFSATKSIISILAGIAIDHGDLDGVDQLILPLFNDLEIENDTDTKDAITIEHLLTMRSGLNTSVWLYSQADCQDDWLACVLNASANEPGSRFHYTDGNAHLLVAAIETATGMSIDEYAEAHLFQPLGITSARWELAPGGVHSGDGLYLSPYDMARIGYLYLNDGEWNGQQIVSADWVATSTYPDVNSDYGYMWWLFDGYYVAGGHRGQIILVAPELDLVVVTTADMDPFAILSFYEASLRPTAEVDTLLPENHQEAERLVNELQHHSHPEAEVVPSAPDIQNTIEEQRFVFDPNDLNWKAATLSFDDTEAQLLLETTNGSYSYTLSIGLDGVARVNVISDPMRFISDASVAMSGQWRRDNLFVIDARYVDGREHWVYSITFGDNVQVQARETILAGVIDSSFRFVGIIEE